MMREQVLQPADAVFPGGLFVSFLAEKGLDGRHTGDGTVSFLIASGFVCADGNEIPKFGANGQLPAEPVRCASLVRVHKIAEQAT